MIVITGAAGFIGSCLVRKLLDEGYDRLIVVDDYSRPEKMKNLDGKSILKYVHRDVFIEWLEEHAIDVDFIFHIGARTDTTEFDVNVFDQLNLNYTKSIWNSCTKHAIPLVYASSAATYGLGEFGYNDDHSIVDSLKPLNPYGESKNNFDKWALKQIDQPPFWAGMKFFNVYGPNEYHKGRMASVIFHSFLQIKEKGKVKLFRSHRPDFIDGMQLRDFVYVKDVIDVLYFMMIKHPQNGLYNLGTGKARAFLHLAQATFSALHIPENIDFIDTPVDIRNKYQYFTEANMAKLITAGYNKPFTSLEDGVKDYVNNYLSSNSYF